MNKFLIIGLALLCTTSWASEESHRVRRVSPLQDQIVTVRTALGIATIIQVPDRPNSVVVGDQDSFKVEYLDQAITIKPLHGNAKSNLYVYTDWRRYNIQLIAGPEGVADYVVYLQSTSEKKSPARPSFQWAKYQIRQNNEAIEFLTKRLGKTQDGILLIEFEMRSKKQEGFKPEWLWLTQNGATKPIHNLFLSALEFKTGEPIRGSMQVLKTDVNADETLRIEMRRKKTSFLTLPKVNAWK